MDTAADLMTPDKAAPTAPVMTSASSKQQKKRKANTEDDPSDPTSKKPKRGFYCSKDGLISHKRMAKGSKAVYKRNAEQSPLLRLPAEVRKRICDMVVGGLQISIAATSKTVTSFMTEHKLSVIPDTHMCWSKREKNLTWHKEGGTWVYSGWQWEGNYNDKLKVTVLPLVCRQLHQETSLTILSLNLFSFQHRCLSNWSKSLKPAQCKALQHLYIQYDPKNNGSLPAFLLRRFSGLRELFYEDRLGEVLLKTGEQVKKEFEEFGRVTVD